MPISSRTSYDNTGHRYNVTRILNPDATLNREAYNEYSPLMLSTTFAMSYGLSFASICSTIVHTILYFRKQIWVQSRRSLSEQPDIHARLMSRYSQVPAWWYAIIFCESHIVESSEAAPDSSYDAVSMFAFGLTSILAWPSQFPVWGFILALVIAFFYVIPIGMIQALTNQQVGLK